MDSTPTVDTLSTYHKSQASPTPFNDWSVSEIKDPDSHHYVRRAVVLRALQ